LVEDRSLIVDSHVHVTAASREAYPQLASAPDWPVTPIQNLVVSMDALGIAAAVLVQTFFTYGTDNRYAIDAAAQYPSRFKVVCVIDQTAPSAPATLTDLVRNHGVCGLRLMPKGHPEGILSDPATFPVWETATELNIPVTIAAEAQHLPHMPPLVKRFPAVPICFEHMWGLEFGSTPLQQIKPILDLADFPNVFLKLCPNNSHAIRKTALKPRSFFGAIVERFGPRRLMWGSNFPAHTQKFGSLADRLRIMQEDFAFLSAEENSWFFAGTALSLWPMPCAQEDFAANRSRPQAHQVGRPDESDFSGRA
jgi:L-fuconolactonase